MYQATAPPNIRLADVAWEYQKGVPNSTRFVVAAAARRIRAGPRLGEPPRAQERYQTHPRQGETCCFRQV